MKKQGRACNCSPYRITQEKSKPIFKPKKAKMKINTPEQNIVDTLKGKKILLLENDYSIPSYVKVFTNILDRNGIEFTSLTGLERFASDHILMTIKNHDAIVFSSQWITPLSVQLRDYIRRMKDKKIFVEIYIYEPTWYYKSQHNSVHDVFVFRTDTSYSEDKYKYVKFYKLTNKPYWEYKNEFDK
jgi:hypothetical protein